MCGAFEIVLVRLAQSLTFTRKGRTMHFWHRLKIEGAGWSIVLFVTVMELFQFLCFWGLPDPFCPSSRAVELGATTGGWWLLPTGFHFQRRAMPTARTEQLPTGGSSLTRDRKQGCCPFACLDVVCWFPRVGCALYFAVEFRMNRQVKRLARLVCVGAWRGSEYAARPCCTMFTCVVSFAL